MEDEKNKADVSYRIGIFNIMALLDAGLFGHVFIAEPGRLSKNQIILKLQKKSLQSLPSIEREIVNLTNIANNGKTVFVVNYLGCFQTSGFSILVLEYIEGSNLKRHLLTKGVFSENHAKFYAACIFLALRDINSLNIIHGDLKLQNIAIGRDGYPKLVDFGNSLNISDKDSKLSIIADYKNLGKCLHEMLTGETIRAAPLIESTLLKLNLSSSSLKFIKKLTELTNSDYFSQNVSHSILLDTTYFEDFDWNSLRLKRMKPPFYNKYIRQAGKKYTQYVSLMWHKISSANGPSLAVEKKEIPFLKCWADKRK